MEFLVVLLIIWFVAIVSSAAQRASKAQLEEVVDAVKTCPPHQWYYHDIKDTEGNVVKWKMVCKVCGPLKPTNGPARVG